jgi:uncharacterized protein (TIRG00374 family)
MKWWWKLAISALLLGLILTILPAYDVFQAMGRIPAWLWWSALGGFLVGHLLGAAKWRILINAGRNILGTGQSIQCYAAGLFANLCLPGIVGGDILRAGLAQKVGGRPAPVILGSVLDRVMDVVTLGILIAGGSIALGAVHQSKWTAALAAVAIGGLGLGAVVLPLVLLRSSVRRWPTKWRRPVRRMQAAIRSLFRRPGVWATAQLYSLTIQGGFVLLNAAIGWSLGIDAPLAAWFVAWPMAKLAGLIPISLGGLAVREAALASLLLPFGVSASLGVAASLLWQTILIAGGLAAGFAWLMLRRGKGSPAGATADSEIQGEGHV